jgi:starch synthase (maltosyl-transferring)
MHAFKVNQESSAGLWDFFVPTGQGEHIFLTIGLEMSAVQNAIRITFYRHPAGSIKRRLHDNSPVNLILRPDIEDRNFHETTKAYSGPEHAFPNAVIKLKDGFIFSPDPGRQLHVKLENSNFVFEPEWHYMVYRSDDAIRGLDPDSDLFSPGYFSFFIKGDTHCELTAQILQASEHEVQPFIHGVHDISTSLTTRNRYADPLEKLCKTLEKFVVKRGNLKTVIAGYPWFLDWGRDSLIFVRGLIAANRINIARQIIKQFGIFEEKGTIPNMIQGNNAGNRNTSDAPLWFIIACSDLVHAEGNSLFLETNCNRRTLREILFSIGRSFQNGTSSGVIMDTESGLIFSPSHFTWMDTNHPAGTPRQGYPIEIQALWFAALSFFNKIDPSGTQGNWKKLAKMVKKSISDLFIIKGQDFLSDCLHARAGQSAKNAAPDDALRPNQLFAVTLNAVTEPATCQRIVMSCQELLVPGAIRSLADRQVQHPVHVTHNGKALNDPYHPYMGEYKGDEDTERKPAYHNSTAWTWLFPVFCEAWVKAFGKKAKNTALAWLSSSTVLMNHGCVGHVPEILDGNYPHTQRGCDAQAWGTSELLRVWKQMEI